MDKILQTNCSEATCRIKLEGLTKSEITQLTDALRKAGDGSTGDDYDWASVDGSNEFYESEVFGIKILQSKGEFPFNGSDTIDATITKMEKKFNKKIKWENED